MDFLKILVLAMVVVHPDCMNFRGYLGPGHWGPVCSSRSSTYESILRYRGILKAFRKITGTNNNDSTWYLCVSSSLADQS